MFDPTQLSYSLVRQSALPVALLWAAGTIALLWMDWPGIGLALLAAFGIRGFLSWTYADAAVKGLTEERQVLALNWALGLPDELVDVLVRKYRLGGWSQGLLIRAAQDFHWLIERRLSPWDLVILDMDAADARSALHQKARRGANAEHPRDTLARLGDLHAQETALLADLPTRPPYGFLTWIWLEVRGQWWRLRARHRMRAVNRQPAERADEVQP